MTNSSAGKEVLFTVNVLGGMSLNVFEAAISTWPDPVGAITTAIWFGLLKPGLSIFWEVVVLFVNWIVFPVPVPELKTVPLKC